MRFKIGHPDFPAYDHYILSYTPEIEAQINRLGPHQVVSNAHDWPTTVSRDWDGWTDTLNTLYWPRGADQFSSLLILCDDYRAGLVDSLVAAQTAAWTSQTQSRPYVILQAMLAPAEAARAAETYTPAGAAAGGSDTELIAWKMYPLPPVRLPQADDTDTYGGLWILPLVDERYFRRVTPVWSVIGGSGRSGSGGAQDSGGVSGASGDPDFPIVNLDYDEPAPWMPALRTYPLDQLPPADFQPVEDNGTSRAISATTPYGLAADTQAQMEGWKVVCRDVRSSYSCVPGGTPHSDFTGVLCDYPDPVAFLAYFANGGSVVSPGAFYKIGDILTIVGGTGTAATYRVTAVDSGGGVVGITIETPGEYTTPPPGDSTSGNATSGGTGTGCLLYVTTARTPSSSYHQDAIRLGEIEGNLIAGGQPTQNTVLYLEPQKIHFLFGVYTQEAEYSILLRKTVQDAKGVGDFTDDQDGPTLEERRFVPHAILGTHSNRRIPLVADRARMLRAAKQWASLYYRWRRKQRYFKFPGIAPVIPNGHAQFIRWSFSSTDFSTIYDATERTAPDDPAVGVGGAADDDDRDLVRFIQVVGPFDEYAQRYPGVVMRQEDLPVRWPVEPGSCWLIGANNEILAIGRNYLARAGSKFDGLTTWATFCCDGSGSGGVSGGSGDGSGPPESYINCTVCGGVSGYPTYLIPPMLRVVVRPTFSAEWAMIKASGFSTTLMDTLLATGWYFPATTVWAPYNKAGLYWPVDVVINPSLNCSGATAPSGFASRGHVDMSVNISCAYNNVSWANLLNGSKGLDYLGVTGRHYSGSYETGGCGSYNLLGTAGSPQWTKIHSFQPLRATIYLHPGTIALEIYGYGKCL